MQLAKGVSQKAEKHLKRDVVLRPVVSAISLPKLTLSEDLFNDLARSIISQQVSVAAANAIYGKFLTLFDGELPKPRQLLERDEVTLRSAGLSRQKAAYVRNVATYFDVPEHRDIHWQSLPDEEVLKHLTAIKGVGQWTAQIILIFSLGRPDVFVSGDLGVVEGIRRLYDLRSEKKALKNDLSKIAENWKPYRSFACRYIWTWVDQNKGAKQE